MLKVSPHALAALLPHTVPGFVLDCCLIALILRLIYQGVIDARGRQTLSQLIFWIFVPALIFTKLAGSVNLSNLKIWWAIHHIMFSFLTWGSHESLIRKGVLA